VIAKIALAGILLAWVGALFTVPILPAAMAAAVIYVVVLVRANRLADEYVETSFRATGDPFSPRGLHRP
jgi:hypothetical protein